MSLIENNSLSIVPYANQSSAKEQPRLYAQESFSTYMRSLAENLYLSTYKALHLGGNDTFESRMIRSTIANCPTHSESETAQRLTNYNKITHHLNHLTDEHLLKLLDSATPLGTGMGGDVLSMEVEGVPLFVKKIRLTDIEKQNPRSTHNHFELPSFYQYGVGSRGCRIHGTFTPNPA